MDREYPQTDERLRGALVGNPRRILHGPFNELFPCAIDPEARDLAARRYRQAIALARDYGADKVVIHAGFNPWLYYPVWFREQSAVFWREFLAEEPGVEIVLENVLEQEPEWMTEILRAVDSPRLRLCLDVGHVNAYSPVPVSQWIDRYGSRLRHLHMHNNDGSADTHSPVREGTLDIPAIAVRAKAVSPEATFTLELPQAAESVRWLTEQLFIDN